MMNGFRKQTTLIVLLLWVVAASPFVSFLAISSHGYHDATVSLHGKNIEVNFHHGHDATSHSHEENHKHDTEDHHVTVSLEDSRAPVQFSITAPDPIFAFSLKRVLVSMERSTALLELANVHDRIDKTPSAMAHLKATVLLI